MIHAKPRYNLLTSIHKGLCARTGQNLIRFFALTAATLPQYLNK